LLETEPESGPVANAAPDVRGIDPEAETNVSSLATSVVDGKFDVSGNGILIGSVLADKIGVSVGDRVNIYAMRALKKIKESRDQGEQAGVLPDEYEVRGIFDVGYYEFNAQVVVVSLENAQDLYDLTDSVHGLMVMLRDPFEAPKVKRQLREILPPQYRVSTWLEES